ncbi:hypothetical protein C2845_PM08G16640 [Panicum miliaceum]|uniref:Uncharacterized protein n=1 Tax=Panicum miliaceum TaxID=4540 RepID=A0A3L6QZ66_PANMI|nr:hypothetical protein C2845_PM08G16640 [Panicum miliaceum]
MQERFFVLDVPRYAYFTSAVIDVLAGGQPLACVRSHGRVVVGSWVLPPSPTPEASMSVQQSSNVRAGAGSTEWARRRPAESHRKEVGPLNRSRRSFFREAARYLSTSVQLGS